MDFRVTYDKEADAAYIYLTGFRRRGCVQSVEAYSGRVVLDFDADGRLIGIEVLSAQTLLSDEIRSAAERLDSAPESHRE